MSGVFSPFTVDNWIVATLKATAGATTVMNGQTVAADAVALVADRIYPLRENWTSDLWPVILYQPLKPANVEDYVEESVLEDGLYKIFMVMRQDKLTVSPLNWTGDIEDFTKQGYIAISAAFQGVKDSTLGGEGIVHGSSVVQKWQRLYGNPGLYVSEMGVVAHIYST